MVQLTPQLVAQLDEEASQRHVSRSALIREVLEEHFVHSLDKVIAQKIVDGYTRIPPGTPDVWGELCKQADVSTSELIQRLNAEETQAGKGPW